MPTLSSTTSTPEQMEHALSEDWRKPPVPKEQPAPSATEAPEAQETEPETTVASETAEETESKKPKSRAQRAIDKLTARNHRLEAELEDLRKKAAPAETKSAPAQPSGPPKLQDFLSAGKTADDWADARDQWKQAEDRRQAAAEEQQEVFDTYNRGVSEARARYEDFDEVVEAASGSIPEAAGYEIFEIGKQGADIAYYLAKNPDVCEELMELTPIAAKHAIRELADSILKKSTKAASSPSDKPAKAKPAPITPVGGSSTQASVPLEQMSPKDYIRTRNEQERKRRGR